MSEAIKQFCGMSALHLDLCGLTRYVSFKEWQWALRASVSTHLSFPPQQSNFGFFCNYTLHVSEFVAAEGNAITHVIVNRIRVTPTLSYNVLSRSNGNLSTNKLVSNWAYYSNWGYYSLILIMFGPSRLSSIWAVCMWINCSEFPLLLDIHLEKYGLQQYLIISL
jgi:hypothetical protein